MASLDSKITAAKANLKTLHARLKADVTTLARTKDLLRRQKQMSKTYAPELGFFKKHIMRGTKKKTPSPDPPTKKMIEEYHHYHQKTNRMANKVILEVLEVVYSPAATPAQKKKIKNLDTSLQARLRQMTRHDRPDATKGLAILFESLRPSPPAASAKDSQTGSFGRQTARMLAAVESPSPKEVDRVVLEITHPGSSAALQTKLNQLMGRNVGHGSRKTHKRRRRKYRRHQTKRTQHKRRKRRKRCKPTRRHRRRKRRNTRRR